MAEDKKIYDVKLNPDTATAYEIEKANEKLHEHLLDKGELLAADRVEGLMKKPVKPQDKKLKSPVYGKLLRTNKGILSVLKRIQEDMFDEQDTSFKQTPQQQENDLGLFRKKIGYFPKELDSDDDDNDWGRKRRRKDKRSKDKKSKDKKSNKKSNKKSKDKTRTRHTSTDKGKSKTRGKGSKPSGFKGKQKTPKISKSKAKGGFKQLIKKVKPSTLKHGAKGTLKTLAKGAKFIPIAGLVVGAGMAAWEGADGWNNASAITGIPEENLTKADKASAAAASIVSGLTFGLVSPESIIGKSKKMGDGVSDFILDKQKNRREKKHLIKMLEGSGVIDKKAWGKSEVTNWDRLRRYPPYMIQDIIDIDDWDENTLKGLKDSKREAEIRSAKKRELKKGSKGKIAPLSDKQNKSEGQSQKAYRNTGEAPRPRPKQKGYIPGLTKPPVASPRAHSLGKGSLTSTGDIKEYIKSNEGLRLKPYNDSLGYPTIGYGHLITPGEDDLFKGITQEQADEMFEKDFEEHWSAAMKIPTFNKQPDEVQNVLADMTYNLGPKWWTKWPNTMSSLQKFDHGKVAEGIENSLYYTQVGKRSKNNVNILRNVGEKYAQTAKPEKESDVSTTTEPQEFVPESNKEPKENMAAAMNENLKNNTVAYEKTGDNSQPANVTQPVINSTNIAQNEEVVERPLGGFAI